MPSHLTKRRNLWFVRQNIPADVQTAFNGRKLFIASTHETDPKRANGVAGPTVAAWQTRIDEARLNKPDRGRLEIDRLIANYKRLKATDLESRVPADF
jgi:hypothetical protein